MIFFRSGFNTDSDVDSLQTVLHCEDESLAIQSARDEADINTIVRRFGLTGELPSQVAMPRSGDFTDIPDFHTAMNMIRSTQEAFMSIPADIRARFSNDPQQLMEFLENDANRDEARKLGFLNDVPVMPPSGTPDGGAPQA